MKKNIAIVVAGFAVALSCAAERTVDTRFISAPGTAFFRKDPVEKSNRSAGVDIRDRSEQPGMVILDNGKFGKSRDNLVYELQIGNLKRIKLRTASGASSLAWATYDAEGNVCRLGPVAKVETSGTVDPKMMERHEIVFQPQEKIVCFSVGKAVRGKMKILYFTGSAAAEK